MKSYNIYCDESCHLENDHQQVMVLGALWCPTEAAREIAKRIKKIKSDHGLNAAFEIKWTKISPVKVDFYMDLVSYFFEEKNLFFRGLIIPDKSKLRHKAFQHDHDTWYYKMYFELLKVLLNPFHRFRIFLDIKDSRSGEKVLKLHEVLSYNNYDFDRQIVERIQNVHSHEIEQVQLADLLIGCVMSANKAGPLSVSKSMMVQQMRELSDLCLRESTPFRHKKVNLFRWAANEESDEA